MNDMQTEKIGFARTLGTKQKINLLITLGLAFSEPLAGGKPRERGRIRAAHSGRDR